MKRSRWNSYIEITNSSGLIYNSLKDEFVFINGSSLFDLCKDGPISAIPETVLGDILKIGGIVAESVDEVKELRNLIKTIDEDDSHLHLIINPTLDCNFHCWYCYENHVRDSCMSSATVEAIKLLIEKKIDQNNNFRYLTISFFGGEPLMKFHEVVEPLVKWINEYCDTRKIALEVHFTTNSYLLDDNIINILKDWNVSFQITLDGGKESHDNTRFEKGGKGSFDIIMHNIAKLASIKKKVVLRINYTKNNIMSISDIIGTLERIDKSERRYIHVDFQRVWQDSSKVLSDEEADYLRDLRNQLMDMGFSASISNHLSSVKNSCYGDKLHEYLINYNGDVFACTARDFKSENRLGKISVDGEIEWNQDLLDKRNNIKFSKEVCHQCRIAPLCGGGCKTKCMEASHHDGCNLGFTEAKIDQIILERFERYFLNTSSGA